jgi:hypothetical protein
MSNTVNNRQVITNGNNPNNSGLTSQEKTKLINQLLETERLESENKVKATEDISNGEAKKWLVVLAIILFLVGAFFLIWHFVLEKYVNSSADNFDNILNSKSSKSN